MDLTHILAMKRQELAEVVWNIDRLPGQTKAPRIAQIDGRSVHMHDACYVALLLRTYGVCVAYRRWLPASDIYSYRIAVPGNTTVFRLG